jgi:hypothetical protein
MADITNLRRFIKEKQREAKARSAAANAAKHGQTKAQKAKDKASAAALVKHLDAHKKDDT